LIDKRTGKKRKERKRGKKRRRRERERERERRIKGGVGALLLLQRIESKAP